MELTKPEQVRLAGDFQETFNRNMLVRLENQLSKVYLYQGEHDERPKTTFVIQFPLEEIPYQWTIQN